jgi:predicted small secreted protein
MRMHRAIRHCLWLVVAAVLLVACNTPGGTGASTTSNKPKAAVTPRVAGPGWTLFTNKKEGFALSLPSTWQQIELSKETLSQAMSQVRSSNPGMANVLSSQAASMAAQGVKFFGYDMYSPTLALGFATNVNVAKQATLFGGPDLNDTIKEVMKEVKTEFKDSLSGPVTSTRIKTRGGMEIGRINFNITLNMPNGSPMTMALIQYVASGDNGLYLLTCTTTANELPTYSHTFEDIAKSIYLLN